MPTQTYDDFMPRSETESARLNEQGLMYEAAFDYMIHPDIAARLPSSPCIADIATGTGDYLVRLARTYPADSRFHGFDISPKSFCAEDVLPRNVKLHLHDIRTPFPTEFHNQCDLVHLRLIAGGLAKDDWAVATRHVLQILRPGGAIQWEENDLEGSRVLRGGKAGSTPANLRILVSPFVALYKDRFTNGFSVLPEVFREAGLQGVAQDVVSLDRVLENRRRHGPNVISAIQHWAQNMEAMGNGTDHWPGHRLEDLIRKGYEEVKDGAYARYDIFATIGFKPQ